METKTDKLEVIAKTGGIKLASDKDKWINPAKESKDKILENLDKIREWQGKKVVVEMIDDSTYSGIGLSEDQDPEPDQNASDAQGTSLLDPKHIIKLQGKDFVKHEGLLEVAHKIGLVKIQTEMLSSPSDEIHLFKAKVTLKGDKQFEAYGDASKENTNRGIASHIIRMAETRAVNRALRFATNIGLCSIDELGGDDDKESKETPKPEFKSAGDEAKPKETTPKAKDQKKSDPEPEVTEIKI